MDDTLLTDSNKDTLEHMFEMMKEVLPLWGLQIAPEKKKEEIAKSGTGTQIAGVR